MRGAAVHFAGEVNDFSLYDGIFVSNMISVSDLRAICRIVTTPIIVYFHENQILYPLAEGEKEDLHYGFTDITTALSADYIIFNSQFHCSSFIKALHPFLSRFPDKIPYWVIDEIQKKSRVLYPGCLLDSASEVNKESSLFPVIIWNHRWEHDKNPEDFFNALFTLQDEGIHFKLIVLGEKYKKSPEIFETAYKKLHKEIIHFGYCESVTEYQDWLRKGDIVISTSNQENFGISVVEAIGYSNFPLLPQRLSYSELIPEKYHKLCLYRNQKDLVKKLKKLIRFYNLDMLKDLVKQNLRFSWNNIVHEYDEFLDVIQKKSR